MPGECHRADSLRRGVDVAPAPNGSQNQEGRGRNQPEVSDRCTHVYNSQKMVSSTIISLRSDDIIENLLSVEFDTPADRIQRVHLKIGANTFNMTRGQYDALLSLLMKMTHDQLVNEKFSKKKDQPNV